MKNSRKTMTSAKALMADAKAERAIVNTPEARALQERLIKAVTAYCEYLGRNGLFYGEESDWTRALRVTCYEWGDMEIILQGGALDRCYGDGVDLDWLAESEDQDMTGAL